MNKIYLFYHRFLSVYGLIILSSFTSFAQSEFSEVSLLDRSFFANPDDNWKIVGNVFADLQEKEALETKSGSGILANLPSKKHRSDLYTTLKHGDIDLELEFMMAKGSNSGIYLQGRYEVQLLDSWGKAYVSHGDCGGIYHRWVEETKEGYEGTAPRLNVSKAPGIWQKLKISFQAPRFDQYNNKIANAKILKVQLNGVIIHENIELTGPTRGGGNKEDRLGPLRFQGDHGPVAFRNIKYQLFGKEPLRLEDLSFEHYYTEKDNIPDLAALKPVKTGQADVLSYEIIDSDENFTLRFSGNLPIKEEGRYTFYIQGNGNSLLNIDGKSIVKKGWGSHSGSAELSAGIHPMELVYAKKEAWRASSLGLFVEGPGIHRHPLHVESSVPSKNMAPPIFINFEKEPFIHRSFMDIQPEEASSSYRVSHAASVAFPEKVAYTYDMENGSLLQIWRSAFLEATPMWHNRGNGNAKPMGSKIVLGGPPAITKLTNMGMAWPDSLQTEQAFRAKGYTFDKTGIPSFHYQTYGLDITDRIEPKENGKHLHRTLSLEGRDRSQLYLQIAKGHTIEKISDQLFLIDKAFYVQFPKEQAAKPVSRKVDEKEELLLPLNESPSVQYELIW